MKHFIYRIDSRFIHLTPVSYLAHAVVGQFDVTLVVQKDIVQFQISVHYACEHKTRIGWIR